ncbi:hypothetical protein CLU79DRAFT_775549 [Phycomyces nitens]|nr:hypothetical protein CLU79DRAFT_775549 [Phycomyces nitens]
MYRPMVNMRRIAPHPGTNNLSIMDRLTSMEHHITTVTGEVVAVRDQLTTMTNSLGIINRVQGSNDTPGIHGLASPVTAADINSPVILPDLTRKKSTDIYKLIRNFMWKSKIKSTNLAEIAANNSKPRWNTSVFFNASPNKELVADLLAFIEPRLTGSGLRRSDIRKSIYSNFTSRRRKDKEDPAVRAALNTRSRRTGRQADLLNRRLLAYTNHKDVIDKSIGEDCSGLIQKSTMSEGESDYEGSMSSKRRVISVTRPGWRSDKFNQFLEMIDAHVTFNLGCNSHQVLPRIITSVSISLAPTDLDPPLPQWTLRDMP